MGKIQIEIVNVRKEASISKKFNCNECRAITRCNAFSTCRVADYICQRANVHDLKMDDYLLSMTVVGFDNDEFEKARNIVNRSIRLASHKCNTNAR